MNAENCLAIIQDIFSSNQFVKHCGILIDEVGCGWAKLHMPISDEVHTNLTGFVHGGALSTLANTAVGVACCTVGARTVTLNIVTDFIGNLRAGDTAWAEAKVTHHGRRTIVLSAEIYDDAHNLLSKTMASMYVKGEDDRIPARW
ncbi:MAG: PaaI family thioesterase [Schwartzia sp. (in: firmicutes)]